MSASQSGRRLRSSFDVFDIVNNAISSGVKEAKKTTNKALNDVKKLVNQSEQDIDKAVDEVVNLFDHKAAVHDAQAALDEAISFSSKAVNLTPEPVVEEAAPEETHIVQMAAPEPEEETKTVPEDVFIV